VNKIKPLTLTGRAVIEEAPNAARPIAGIKLTFPEIGAASSTTTLIIVPPTFISQADGSFMVQGTRVFSPTVPPYAYRVRPADLPPGIYVKAIRGVDAEMFKPEPGQTVDVTVVVGNDAGTLEGIVKDTKGGKVPLGAVVLIPDEPNSSLRISTATSGASGAYKIQAGPGTYHLYAWHEMIGAPYLNVEYMKGMAEKGIAVRITANGHATLDVTAIE
jgi:hypothetical protein